MSIPRLSYEQFMATIEATRAYNNDRTQQYFLASHSCCSATFFGTFCEIQNSQDSKISFVEFLSNHGSDGLNSLKFYDWEFALKPWIQFAISWSSHISIGMPFVYLHFSVPSSLPRKAALRIHQGGGVREGRCIIENRTSLVMAFYFAYAWIFISLGKVNASATSPVDWFEIHKSLFNFPGPAEHPIRKV